MADDRNSSPDIGLAHGCVQKLFSRSGASPWLRNETDLHIKGQPWLALASPGRGLQTSIIRLTMSFVSSLVCTVPTICYCQPEQQDTRRGNGNSHFVVFEHWRTGVSQSVQAR
jgi:hypothetical protein